jgi:methanogenic corrinoid protein MtbC1
MPAQLPVTNSQALYELLADRRLAEAAEVVDSMSRGRLLSDVVAAVLDPVLHRIGADLALDVVGPEVEVAAVAFVRSTLSRLAGRGPWKTQTGRRAVTALPTGEEHDLGLEMVATLLARDGWCVCRAPRGEAPDALVTRIVSAAPELVCLSATSPATLVATAELIRTIHAEVPETRVMVGGLAFRLVPERAVRVGADLFAEDARAAVEAVRGTFGG